MIELKMIFELRNLCVKIYLWDKKQKKFLDTNAVFDTGANITHIDTGILKRLGYDVDNADISYVSTMGSRSMKINNTVVDNVKLGDLELGTVAVHFSNMSDMNASVILGMNILKEFNITLDFENELITMKPTFDIESKRTVEDFSKNDSRFGLWLISQNDAGAAN
jgi:hypothetical protein